MTDYNAIDAVNISTLKELWAKSPRHYRHRLQRPSEPTPAMQFGTLVHCAVLEPDRLAERFIAEPDFGDCRLKANKAARDAWRAEFEGSTAERISAAWVERVERIAEAVRTDPVAAPYLSEGRPEVVLQWRDEETGLACKGRVDWLSSTTIVGLKTTKAIDTRKFASQAASLGYALQWAFYHDGYAASNVALPLVEIVVETEPPFDVVVYRIPDDVLDEGRNAYRDALLKLKSCRTFNDWPGVANGNELTFALPRWATTHDDDDLSDLEWGEEHAA